MHTFCESCALRNYGKTDKCFICRKETHGIFNLVENANKDSKEPEGKEKKPEQKQKPKPEEKEEEDEERTKLFKEYEDRKRTTKEQTYDPVGGWVIP